MTKHALTALTVALTFLGIGCVISNYPVIFDSRGTWGDSVMEDQYGQAYIVPEIQIAYIYSDGTEEIYTQVSQDWKGDQWLKTYVNYDPTGSVTFLDQTYCDPTRQDCAFWVSWNPDLPDWNHSNPPRPPYDLPWDGELHEECSGVRSFYGMSSISSRIGECGSGVWAAKQNLAAEFAMLERTTFRGREVYALPVDQSNTSVLLTDNQDRTVEMPIYGRVTAYIDDDLRMALPVTANMRYFARWQNHYIDTHGGETRIHLTYGSLEADYDIKLLHVDPDAF